MYTLRGLKLGIEARALSTHKILISECVPLEGAWQGPSQYLKLRLNDPKDDVSMHIGIIWDLRSPHQGHNLGRILQMGMKHHYLDADDKTGDVRASVDYVKGFTEGSDAVLAAVEQHLVRFAKYVASADDGALFIPPRDNPYRTRIKDLAEHTMKEWENFKSRGMR